jgi:hypothetical protein
MTDALAWRVDSLEKTAIKRDDLINKIAGQQEDQLRKLDRLIGKVDSLAGQAGSAHDAAEKVAKILAAKAERELWAAEEEAKARESWRNRAWWGWAALSLATAMYGLVSGAFTDAVGTIKAFLGAVK